MNGYAVTAQFYDLVAAEVHAGVDLEIVSALEALTDSSFPIVDIGAGTGLTTSLIARVLPDADIIAVEQDPAMRAALMTRVCSDPLLRQRVTVLPRSVLSVELPPTISAAVASASLGHFSPGERLELWALLADRLSPGGRALLEIQSPSAEDVAEHRMARAQVGRITYEAWGSARRVGHDRQSWCIRYVASLDGVEIDFQAADFVTWVLSADQAIEEARRFGLAGKVESNLVILQAPESAS